MSVKGQVFLISDTTKFFTPIVLGSGPPTTGFVPSANYAFVVKMSGYLDGLPFFPFSITADVSTSDASFELPDFPAMFGATNVAISLTLLGFPYYRSQYFPYENAKDGLDIYLYEPRPPTSDGITAGQVSTALATSALPGNTKLTANASGLNVAGSKSEVSLQFGIQITPDTSPNLDIYFDLALNGWNIHVGWPESWCESAHDVLKSIRSGLQTAGSSANAVVASQITSILEGAPLNLPAFEASALLKNVTIQFVYVAFPNTHTWALKDKTDSTVVIFPQPTIGYPRRW